MLDINPSAGMMRKYLPHGAGLPQPEMTQGASAITGSPVAQQQAPPPMIGGMEVPPNIMQLLGGMAPQVGMDSRPTGGFNPNVNNTMPIKPGGMPPTSMGTPGMRMPPPVSPMNNNVRPMAPQVKPTGNMAMGGMMQKFASGNAKPKKSKNRY